MFLSSNITHLRKENGMTITALGKKIGKSNTVVGQYEKGTATPPLSALIALHNFFKLDLETLVFMDLRKIPLVEIKELPAAALRTMILPEGKRGMKELLFDMETLVDKMKTAIREQEK
jgi:transcriptional regulator with XRE-family HTH domain